MSPLDDIAVTVEPMPPGGAAEDESAGLRAVLTEVLAMIERYLRDGTTGGIDLRSLPMSGTDRDALRRALGTGEVSAVVDALGPSTVAETAVPGVWWIVHRNTEDEVVAEFIEVTGCPRILGAGPDEIRAGCDALRIRLQGNS